MSSSPLSSSLEELQDCTAPRKQRLYRAVAGWSQFVISVAEAVPYRSRCNQAFANAYSAKCDTLISMHFSSHCRAEDLSSRVRCHRAM